MKPSDEKGKGDALPFGGQPDRSLVERSITLETLKKELPPRWEEQEKLFGIG